MTLPTTKVNIPQHASHQETSQLTNAFQTALKGVLNKLGTEKLPSNFEFTLDGVKVSGKELKQKLGHDVQFTRSLIASLKSFTNNSALVERAISVVKNGIDEPIRIELTSQNTKIAKDTKADPGKQTSRPQGAKNNNPTILAYAGNLNMNGINPQNLHGTKSEGVASGQGEEENSDTIEMTLSAAASLLSLISGKDGNIILNDPKISIELGGNA